MPILNNCNAFYYNGSAVLRVYAGTTLVYPKPIEGFSFSRIPNDFAGNSMGQFRWAGQSAGWPQEGPWPGLKITPVSSAGSTVSLSWPYFNGLPTGGFFELDWELSSYGYKVGDTFNALATNYADDLQTKIVAQSTFLCTIDPL